MLKKNENKNKNKNETKNEIKNENKNENKNKIKNKNKTKNENKNKTKIKNINGSISACLKDCKIFENRDIRVSDLNPSAYKNEKNYQASFENIIKFSKTISNDEKSKINCCIYNASNDDGLFSAWVFYKYLKENGKNINSDINFIPLSAASGNSVNYHLQNQKSEFEDRNVIIFDIAYSYANLKYISTYAKSLYIVDDHVRTKNELNKLNTIEKLQNRWFIGDDKHSAVAYAWKFFFPNKDIPIVVQYIDNDDRKLMLPYLFYDRAFKTYVSYRITHNPYIKSKKTRMRDFSELDKKLEQTDKNFILMVGHYYDEVVNNIKEQVARNASFQIFQGHPVYVLNYNDPVLYKMVARQMISNAEKVGKKIDFAVLWGWEYTTNAYKVFLSEKHSGRPQFNLGEMASKLGKKGGHPMGGKGTRYIGNFYWPRKQNQDIWDLFD